MKSTSQMDRASAEAAMCLLEALPPEALLDHLDRLEDVMAKIRGIKQPGGNKRNDGGTKKAAVRDHEPLGPLDAVQNAVLSDANLAGRILDLDGSLAFYHKNYEFIVGYTSPRPNGPEPNAKMPGSVATLAEILRHRSATRSAALVCKLWKSLVMGDDGMKLWKARALEEVGEKMRIARETKEDPSISWSARLCAMAICDDVKGLKKAFDKPDDHQMGIGAAVVELRGDSGEDEDEDSSDYYGDANAFEPLPNNHPFSRYCLIDCFEERGFDDDERKHDFTVSIAYAAALVGSVGALNFLQSDKERMWSYFFDEKGHAFLSDLVEYACENVVLEGPVASVRALLPGLTSLRGREIEKLHVRHWGGNGNHLHLAAARGHKDLVEALVDGGMDPSKPCVRIAPTHSFGRRVGADSRDKGVKELPLPEDWAKVRGHTEVAELIRRMRNTLRLRIDSGRPDGYQSGKIVRFFPRSDRQYGFIEPGGIFVHLSKLRESAENHSGFPQPGVKVCFTVTKDRRGRKRAEHILSGEDYSLLSLPFDDEWDADEAWRHYDDYGSDDESEDEDDYEDDDAYDYEY